MQFMEHAVSGHSKFVNVISKPVLGVYAFFSMIENYGHTGANVD
jgi:hypothetical protein